MIDLHLHTRASDGAHEPDELVRRVWLAGITTFSVTDHDTLAGLPAAAVSARHFGIDLVGGIEVTALAGDREVHVLGYFIDPASPALADFLAAQRADRVRRVRALAALLTSMGLPIDVEPMIAATPESRSIGRPQVARELVRAGHVMTVAEAFDRWIGEGKPAFVARAAPAPELVIELIHQAGGIASVAHPGCLEQDDLVRSLAGSGLDAIEVYHPDHDEEASAGYRQIASELGLLVTGGSDFHRDDGHRAPALGRVTLPAEDFNRLAAGRRFCTID